MNHSIDEDFYQRLEIDIFHLWIFDDHKTCYTPVAPNLQPPNVQHCTQCAPFFEQFLFCSVSLLCNSQEKFQLQNDKNERKWVKHDFQNYKIDLLSCFLLLISKLSTVIHHKLALVFQNGQKSLFFIKNFISIFSGQCPQCATLFWGV